VCSNSLLEVGTFLISPDRDTVSSVGIIRRNVHPGTNKYDDNFCYFRHALALDERRVKFQPEYVCGGDSLERHPNLSSSTDERPGEVSHVKLFAGGGLIVLQNQGNKQPIINAGLRVKEVWFAGCHSDMYIYLFNLCRCLN